MSGILKASSGASTFSTRVTRVNGQRVIRPQAGALKDAQLGYDPWITELVLGDPQVAGQFPGERIFRRITSPGLTYRFRVHDRSHLKRVASKRGAGAEIRYVDFNTSTETGDIDRHTLATLRDEDEFKLAGQADPAWSMEAQARVLANQLVRLDLEAERAELLTDPDNYPTDHVNDLPLNSEFNGPNGNSRLHIRAAAQQIARRNLGIRIDQDIKVYAGPSALDAIEEDTTWTALRAVAGRGDTPTAEEMQRYFKVAEVWTGYVVMEMDDGELVTLYDDDVLVYYEAPSAGLMTGQGDRDFAVRAEWSNGTALNPWRIENRTSVAYPWQEYTTPRIVKPTSGYLIRNCNANV
ncbi:MAG: hypothetical protein AAGM22_33685 [Acidobacteriota bacterium]